MSLFLTVVILLCITICKSQPTTVTKKQLETQINCSSGDNNACGLKSVKINLKELVAGNRTLEVASSNPLKADVVYGDFSNARYIYHNPKLYGLKDCDFADFKINFESYKLYMELLCPRLNIYGSYRTKGDVFDTHHLDGEGDANIVAYDYLIKIHAPFSINEGPDQKLHIHMDKFYSQYIPRGPVLVHFDSLYTDRKDLSDNTHRFFNENSKELMLAYGHPLLTAFMDIFRNNANKFLSTLPVEDLIYDQ